MTKKLQATWLLGVFLLIPFLPHAQATEPTAPATSVAKTITSCDEVLTTWTNGNGAARIVVMKAGSPVDKLPQDNTHYTVNSTFGQGAHLGNGNYAVYKGASNSATIRGLQVGVTYHFALFEFNTQGSAINYLTHTYPSLNIPVPDPITFNAALDSISCHGADDASIQLNLQGGTTPFTILWNNGSSSTLRSNLSPGTYSVSVTDAVGCFAQGSYLLSEPAPLSLNATTQNISCNAGTDGFINLAPTGGTKPYQYQWSNAAQTEDLNQVTAGSYSVTLTDKNGCTVTGSYTLTEPSPLAVSETINQVSCHGGNDASISLQVSGGNSGYNYNWSHGAGGATTNNLNAGNYSVTVTDNKGCTISKSYQITEPTALTISPTVDVIKCNGADNGAIDLNISGGTTPYTITWNDGAQTESRTNLAAGSYVVTITDNKGCSVQDQFTITEPDTLILTGTTQDIDCHGSSNGAINLIVSGGQTPYQFSWSNGSQSKDLQELPAGQYTVTLTDNNGCIIEQTLEIAQPDPIQIDQAVSNITCYGNDDGSINIAVHGGTPGYQFAWNTGSNSPSLSNLGNGNYSLTVTDDKGCTESTSLEVTEPDSLEIDLDITKVSCDGEVDGELEANISGGTAPYDYTWSNGGTDPRITGLPVGTYQLTVTDFNGCEISDQFALDVSLSKDGCLKYLKIYDVFTPNGDGKNDKWEMETLYEFPDNNIEIYNRWGQLVYQATNYQNDWTGQDNAGEELPAGTYYYILYIHLNGDVVQKAGSVTFIR